MHTHQEALPQRRFRLRDSLQVACPVRQNAGPGDQRLRDLQPGTAKLKRLLAEAQLGMRALNGEKALARRSMQAFL